MTQAELIKDIDRMQQTGYANEVVFTPYDINKYLPSDQKRTDGTVSYRLGDSYIHVSAWIESSHNGDIRFPLELNVPLTELTNNALATIHRKVREQHTYAIGHQRH